MIFDKLKNYQQITTSQQLQEMYGAGWQTPAGISVTPSQAIKFGPVYQCVRVLAESIGMLPLHVYRQKGRLREKALNDPMYSLLHTAPNEFQTSQEWRETIVAHLNLRGNHYSWKNRVRGSVRELLPLNPDAVKPELHDDWTVTYTVTLPGGHRETLPSDDILHIRLMSLDGLVGLSPIEQARNSIGLGMAAEKFGSQLFGNGSRPSGILSTDKDIKDADQLKLLKEQWENLNSGGSQMRTAILSGGLQWTAVSISPEDAQFLETRSYQRSEIAGLFRVPPHMIGDLSKTTIGNIEQQAIDFVTISLMPICTRIEQRIQVSLLQKKTDFFAKHSVNALLRGDMKSRAEFYSKQLQNGALSPNEIREFEDMNPRDGGDIYLTPANMLIDGQQGNDDDQE